MFVISILQITAFICPCFLIKIFRILDFVQFLQTAVDKFHITLNFGTELDIISFEYTFDFTLFANTWIYISVKYGIKEVL